MKINLYLIPFLFLLISCVSKDDLEKLQKENSDLKFEINMQNTNLARQDAEIELYKQQIENLEKKNSENKNQLGNHNPNKNILSTKTFSEEEAINTINDYYDFYERNYVIRNVKVRRKSNSSFWVSYEKVNRKFVDQDFHYNSETKTLEFYENGNYQLKHN